MAYILDGVVILIFLLAIFIGYRRGFFKSIVRLVGCLVAVALAFSLSAPLASGIYDQFISKSVVSALDKQIPNEDTASLNEKLDGVLDSMPGYVVNALSSTHLGTPEEIAGKLSNTVTDTRDQLIAGIEKQVIRPVAVSLLRIVCMFVLFIVFMILVSIAASIIGRVFRLPVLRQMDGTLGAVLGAAEGILLVFVAVSIMSLMAATGSSDAKINSDVMSKTVIVHTVERINPVSGVFQSVFEAKKI